MTEISELSSFNGDSTETQAAHFILLLWVMPKTIQNLRVHVGGAGAPVSSPPVMELMNIKITVQYQ